MGCCTSSPYSGRRYRDPADLDEEIVPLRYFGTNRVGSNLVPDDIGGLPSVHLGEHLASQKDVLLYEAEIDHGQGFRCARLAYCCIFTPWGIAWILAKGYTLWQLCGRCFCDEVCCWVRKEYSTRTYFRIYPNRIEVNVPKVRFPFGYLGCGSWNADSIVAHPFDRGAFGFSHVKTSTGFFLCCLWPMYGGVVARHRCQCNGPLWNRMTDCGGWWCDEWLCKMSCCSFKYGGLADPEEVTFAASIALQAYFEGRTITPQDLQQCLEYWTNNIALRTDPVGRKRPVCCEPFFVPIPKCQCCYSCVHPIRQIPYKDEEVTDQMKEVYAKYNEERARQVEAYKNYVGPVHYSTLCRACGCRRVCGRQGVCFCTEGCSNCSRKPGEPAPPFEEHDFDDELDASTVLLKVIGPPPPNVVIKRWRWDPEKGENYLDVYPEDAEEEGKDN